VWFYFFAAIAISQNFDISIATFFDIIKNNIATQGKHNKGNIIV